MASDDQKLAVLSGLSAFIEGLNQGMAQRAELESKREIEMKKLEQKKLDNEFRKEEFDANERFRQSQLALDRSREERRAAVDDATVKLRKAQLRTEKAKAKEAERGGNLRKQLDKDKTRRQSLRKEFPSHDLFALLWRAFFSLNILCADFSLSGSSLFLACITPALASSSLVPDC